MKRISYESRGTGQSLVYGLRRDAYPGGRFIAGDAYEFQSNIGAIDAPDCLPLGVCEVEDGYSSMRFVHNRSVCRNDLSQDQP